MKDSKNSSSPWSGAHVRLKQLYDQRAPEGMTQKEFGLKHGVGSQSMVAQYLNGIRPLNYESAAKFAKGLRCTIYDISPEMAESLQLEILPFLGKALRRAAMLAGFAVIPALTLTPSPADASSTAMNHMEKGGQKTQAWLANAQGNCVLCKALKVLSFIANAVRLLTRRQRYYKFPKYSFA